MAVDRNHRMELDLSNRTDEPLRLWVEPWAEELVIPPGITWRVVCDAPRPEPIPVEVHREFIVVHGVTQSLVRIYLGQQLLWESRPPLP